jgi:hypothetical protein
MECGHLTDDWGEREGEREEEDRERDRDKYIGITSLNK